MKFRDRILAQVHQSGYRPLLERALADRLGLRRKEWDPFAQELRQLVAQGKLVLGKDGRVAPAPAGAGKAGKSKIEAPKARPLLPSAAKQRPLFQVTRQLPPVVTEASSKRRPAHPATTPRPIFKVSRQLPPIGGESSVAEPKAVNKSQPEIPSPSALKSKTTTPRPSPKSDPGLRTGKIQFRAGGWGFVVPEVEAGEPRPDAVQIPPDETDIALPGDRVQIRVNPGLTRRRDKRGHEQTGKVVAVLERGRAEIVGTLHHSRDGWHVVADDPRFAPDIMVGNPASSNINPTPVAGDKVVARLREWKRRNQPVEGELTERLGRSWEPGAELLGVYRKFGLETRFPNEVEREAAALPGQVGAGELAGRLDYRELPVCTIDPDDAKDFDDALSLEMLDGGEVRVGIHIADVSSYVRSGTALDQEAQRRGNSTYLVGSVVPMLPEKLSNGLCSLVEAQDRLTKAVFLTFDSAGRIKDTTFAHTVIRSRKRLTYKQAYALLFETDLAKIRALPLPAAHQTGSTGRALSALSDKELQDLQGWIRQFWMIASQLRRRRMAQGSLDLDMPETKIFVDAQGYAERLEKIENDESHQLIEEFMLAANEAVAGLTRNARLPSLYRVHHDPDPEKLGELRQLLGTFGIQTGDLTRHGELAKLIEKLKSHPQGHTLRTQLLRSLKKATYLGTPDGHFGLHKRDYTHFTSPIRRYADLVVHRVFAHHLGKEAGRTPGYDVGRIGALAEHLSLTEINSTEAERESQKIKQLEFFERELEKNPRTRFAAIITEVRPHGFFVELVESMVFGLVPAKALGEATMFSEQGHGAIIGRKTKRHFTLGGKIEVEVYQVDRVKRLIDFKPVQSDAKPG